MRTTIIIVIVFMLNTVLLARTPDFDAPHHPTRVLVKFQAGTLQAARQSAHENAGVLQVLEEYSEFEGLQLVEVAKGAVEEAVKAYFDHPSVLHAEPDYDRYPAAVCNSNDPHLLSTDNRLWSIKKVRAPEAWCLTTGDQNFPVAVIDSGIMWEHPDLNANIWTNPLECPGGMGTCTSNGLDEDGNGKIDDFYGWNFLAVPNSNIVIETSLDQWHGTHVAGTIGAVGNNGLGVVGMNWRVKLVALKIMPSSGPTQASLVIAAMNYCIQKNIKVSNNSYGGHGYSVLERDAIQNAGNLIGHIFVAAAGNDGLNLDTNPQYPASYQVTNIITVTATNEDDFRGCMKWVTPLTDPPVCNVSANYGPQTVHLGAPGASVNPPHPLAGIGICSTVYRNAPPVPGYDFKVGTSMAAPHVAGAVALAWAAHPTWTYQQVRSLILNTVDKGTLTGETTTGGRLDIGAALLDCNNNSVADGIDLNTFTSLDCNDNRIPDECDGLGGCCLPEGGGACCLTKPECDNMEGSWSPFLNCLVCLQFAPSGP